MKHKNTLENRESYRQTFRNIFLAMLFFFFAFENNFAQTAPQLTAWNIAPNTLNFSSTPPVVSPFPTTHYAGQSPDYMINNIADASGNLAFAVVDGTIYDKDGYLIDNFKRLGITLTEFSQEISIIPMPGNCTSYYLIFGVKVNLSGGGISYYPVFATIDLTAQNINYPLDPTKKGALQYNSSGTSNVVDLGAITPFVNIYTAHTLHNTNRFGLAATAYRSATNDYLFFIHGDVGLLCYSVSTSGINYVNAPMGTDFSGLPVGLVPTAGGSDNDNYPEMEVIQLTTGNYRIAKIFGNRTICLVDIDAATTTAIPGTEKYIFVPTTTGQPTQITGLEFSPNGQRLYYTSLFNITTSGSPVGFLNLALATPVHTPITFSGVSNLHGCQIEMAHDNKMYFNGGTQLYALSNPNAAPVLANWAASVLLSPGAGFTYTKLMTDQLDGNIYNATAAILSYTASTSALFPSTTQIWTPTNNPFGGTTTNPVGTAANPILVLDKIVIPPGYNITIQGMTFKFKARTITYVLGVATTHYGARVVVENSTSALAGGRLTLSNLGVEPTIFTSDNVCSDGMWEGVEVWGNNTLVQGVFSGASAGKQGWLRLFSAATPAASTTISNAYIGAFTGKIQFAPFYSLLANTGGGIIQAYSNTQFLNNQHGVYFMPYNVGTNVSTFNTMKFTTNTTFVSADNVVPVSHAYLNDVKGIYFRTCTFLNDLATSGYSQIYSSLSQVNIGIRANHSQFYCIPAIFGTTNGCVFEGLKYGVYATYTSNTKTLTVDYGKFINNYRGAYLSAATLTPSIVRSSFHVMNYSHSVLNNRAYGLYLNACNEYKVEENYFTTYTGATTANNYGIIVNNSGPYSNRIYRNTFDKVYIGIQAQNQNCALVGLFPSNPINDFGLKNLCNTFTTIKEMDMGITSGCIDFHQGTNGNPAGNNFSHSGNTAYNDYYTYAPSLNNQGRIAYWYDALPVRTPMQYTPNPEITIASTIIDDPTDHCKTSFSSSHLTLLVDDLKSKINDYQTKISGLKPLLDAGADVALLNAINSTMSPGNLKNLLSSKSPYLSDEVLIPYFTKNGVPNGHLKEIAVANSPLTADVKAVLATVSLPPGIRNQINAAQTNAPSTRQKTIDKVKYYQFEISILKNDIVRNYVNDSTVEIKIDTIISKVKEFEDIDVVSTVKTKEMLADLYIEKQDYVNAEDMIVAIEADPNKQNLAKIKRVHKNLKQSNQTVYDLPSNLAEKQKVEDVAADNNLQGHESAVNIMQEVFNQTYEEPIEELVTELHRYIPMEENSNTIANESIITCYPNPANQSISFEYDLEDETATGSINMYNALGQIVKTITINNVELKSVVSITDLPNGLYFYTLVINNTTIAKDKFVKSN